MWPTCAKCSLPITENQTFAAKFAMETKKWTVFHEGHIPAEDDWKGSRRYVMNPAKAFVITRAN